MTTSLPPVQQLQQSRRRRRRHDRYAVDGIDSGTRVLLVATPGGHTDELRHMRQQLGLQDTDAHWVSSKTAQTESLLASEQVTWVDSISSSEIGKSMRAVPSAVSLHREIRPDLVVSTGAALAAPHLLAASALGCPVWFIESATRTGGPSRVGALAQRLPGSRLFAQGPGWGDSRWESTPSVFDAFRVRPRHAASGHLGSAVVALGSERFPFDRAVAAVRRAVGTQAVDLSWQVGTTECDGLRQWVAPDELRSSFARADVVVTHAGVGSVMAALNEGKVPIVLARRQAHGEHVDDHQLEIAEQLAARGLVIHVDPDELTIDHMRRAARLSVEHDRLSESA